MWGAMKMVFMWSMGQSHEHVFAYLNSYEKRTVHVFDIKVTNNAGNQYL